MLHLYVFKATLFEELKLIELVLSIYAFLSFKKLYLTFLSTHSPYLDNNLSNASPRGHATNIAFYHKLIYSFLSKTKSMQFRIILTILFFYKKKNHSISDLPLKLNLLTVQKVSCTLTNPYVRGLPPNPIRLSRDYYIYFYYII